jgi:hypothetical protein
MIQPLWGMYADAEVIAAAAAAIDGPIVVVAHSYGGIPHHPGTCRSEQCPAHPPVNYQSRYPFFGPYPYGLLFHNGGHHR